MTPVQALANKRESSLGRPPVDKNKAKFWESRLHALLVDRLDHIPNMVRGGRINPTELSRKTGKCRFTIYRWLNSDHISASGAAGLIQIADGRLVQEDMIPFLFA